MNLYTYDGPVEAFGKCITHRWRASTYAVSESRARSNLMYQYKKQNNRMPNCKISLPGKIIMVVGGNDQRVRKENIYERDQLQIEFP